MLQTEAAEAPLAVELQLVTLPYGRRAKISRRCAGTRAYVRHCPSTAGNRDDPRHTQLRVRVTQVPGSTPSFLTG